MNKYPQISFGARKSASFSKHGFKVLSVLVAVFACALILTSCSPTHADSPKPSSAGESQSISIGYKATHLVPELVVAQNQGLFEANGLTVELVPLDDSVVAASIDTDVDFIVGDPITLEAACVGLPVKAVDVLHTGGIQGVARADGTIAATADLAGKRVCVPQTDGFVQLVIEAELIHEGVDPSTVQWIPYEDGNLLQAYSDLNSGTLDAIVWPDPCGEVLQQAGFARFYDSANSELLGNDSTTYLMAASPDAVNDSGVSSKLCLALEDADAYIQEHPEEAASLLAADTSTTMYRNLPDTTGDSVDGGTDLYVNLLGNYQWNPGMDYFDESVRKGIWISLYASQEFRSEAGLVEMDATAEQYIDDSASAISVFGGRG